MPGHNNARFSVYDMMENNGVFRSNPANAYATTKEGQSIHKFQEYPKMLYHPEGGQKMVSPEQREPTPTGIVVTPAKYELDYRVVENEDQEREWRQRGWHESAVAAMRARGDTNLPDDGIKARREQMAKQMEEMQKTLDQMDRQMGLGATSPLPPPKGSGSSAPAKPLSTSSTPPA